MSIVQSKMMLLGTKAPDFELPDFNLLTSPLSQSELQRVAQGEFGEVNNLKKLSQLRGRRATLIMFICNHCPYVKNIQDGLVKLGNDFRNSDVSIIAINANDAVDFPEDGPQKMQQIGKELGYQFPYLFDESQETARAYNAACTPDFFLFDEDLCCVYRGQFDNSRPGGDIPVSGLHLQNAIESLLTNKPIAKIQTPSLGCSIKWKNAE